MDKFSGGVRGDPRRDVANNPGGQHAYPMPSDHESDAAYQQLLVEDEADNKPSKLKRLRRWFSARF